MSEWPVHRSATCACGSSAQRALLRRYERAVDSTPTALPHNSSLSEARSSAKIAASRSLQAGRARREASAATPAGTWSSTRPLQKSGRVESSPRSPISLSGLDLDDLRSCSRTSSSATAASPTHRPLDRAADSAARAGRDRLPAGARERIHALDPDSPAARRLGDGGRVGSSDPRRRAGACPSSSSSSHGVRSEPVGIRGGTRSSRLSASRQRPRRRGGGFGGVVGCYS